VWATSRMIRPPIVGAELWSAVMSAAGYRCQCEGACGSKHTPASQRSLGQRYRCPRTAAVPDAPPLVVAPVEPTVPACVAAALPAEDLRIWCPACYGGALAVARRAERNTPEPTGDLFDPAPYVQPARRSGQYRGGDAA
jgi:hypothetical protein